MKILYFKNNTCKVCKAMEPKIKEIAEEFNIPFQVINTEENPEVAGQFLIFSVPSAVIVDQDDKELTRFVKNFSLLDIKAYIDRYIHYMNR